MGLIAREGACSPVKGMIAHESLIAGKGLDRLLGA
jgi:hypothetical protein